jgi:hypothetical protein
MQERDTFESSRPRLRLAWVCEEAAGQFKSRPPRKKPEVVETSGFFFAACFGAASSRLAANGWLFCAGG